MSFINAISSHDAFTQNGAVSHSTTGDAILNYFSKSGTYRGRKQEEVNKDMSSIFGQDQNKALKAVLYNRMVTRKVNKGEVATEEVQRGQGQKDEFIKSIVWLESNYPEKLYNNLALVPLVGCWKDLWYDSPNGFYHYVKPEVTYELIKSALKHGNHRQLIAKYLPKIRSKSNTTNERHKRINLWAKGLCSYLGWSEKDYRQFKSNPDNQAHLWQRLASSNKWQQINFNTIPGKALTKFVSNTKRGEKSQLSRHGLEKSYINWIKSKPVAKFNGYPYELYRAACSRGDNLALKYTIDKQFEQLISLSDITDERILCALDTSGSMASSYGDNPKPIEICVSLGIYFSALLKGEFKDNVIMFDNTSRMLKLNGSFCDKVSQIPGNAMGGTNFQSVIDEIVRVRETRPQIPLEDYPTTILVVSDMQFNPSELHQSYGYYRTYQSTNHETAVAKLESVGIKGMKFIWWNVNGQYGNDFTSKQDDKGVMMLSGYDGAIIDTLMGRSAKESTKASVKTGQITPLEAMNAALDQEILNLVV